MAAGSAPCVAPGTPPLCPLVRSGADAAAPCFRFQSISASTFDPDQQEAFYLEDADMEALADATLVAAGARLPVHSQARRPAACGPGCLPALTDRVEQCILLAPCAAPLLRRC